jgi:hypothetical protein
LKKEGFSSSTIMTVYENQKACGDSILDALKSNTVFHVLLLSQMQMGKSGTYWYVIFNALFNSSVENVIVMSGNRERDLYKQVLNDKETYTKWFFNQQSIIESYSESELKGMMVQAKNNIKILWGSDLSTKRNPSEPVKNNTLIVWDEAHYAQSEKNSPDVFFKKNNLSKLIDGTISLEEIGSRNIKLLNVSATPFSELIINSEKKDSLHKVVRLVPQSNYCGIKHYIEKGLIQGSVIINAENKNIVKETIKLYKNVNDPKYMIVRVNNLKSGLKVMQEICKELGIVCKRYDSKIVEVDIEDMKLKPEFDTVIVISGMLRMGKVIPKEHISMVYESTTNNNIRKIDTGLQGLLGRVCGYSNLEKGFNIGIYVEDLLIDAIGEYIKDYDSKTGPKNTKSMNLSKTRKKNKHPYTICRIPDADLENEFLTKNGNIQKEKVLNWLKYEFKELKEKFSEKFLELLNDEDTQVYRKNLNKKSNSSFLTLVNKWSDNTLNKSYEHIQPNVYYIVNDNSKLWVIYNEGLELDDNETLVDDELDEDEINSSNVLDKCVFKS